MQFLDFRSLLDEMASEELAPFGPVRGVDFIYRNHTDVYRIRAEQGSLIAHATVGGKSYLKQVRANLELVRGLDPCIPHSVAWRCGTGTLPGRDWAVLVCTDSAGDELSRGNYNPKVWMQLSLCLERIHGLEADGDPPVARPVALGHDPAHFEAFARTLLIRMAELPLGAVRVQRHLDRMADYLDTYETAFRVPPRLVHGDLDRKNIVVGAGRVGLLDWADLGPGDYAFDLAMAKFMLDSVAPRAGPALIRDQARRYRERFQDATLERRLRFFVALAGLVHAFRASDDTGAFRSARAWRVRMAFLHSEAQWDAPLKLDGPDTGAPAVRTEQWALDIQQPFRGLIYLLAPKRVG